MTARQIRSSASGKTVEEFRTIPGLGEAKQRGGRGGCHAKPDWNREHRTQQIEVKQKSECQTPGQRRDREKVRYTDAIAGSCKLDLQPSPD